MEVAWAKTEEQSLVARPALLIWPVMEIVHMKIEEQSVVPRP
jgi:hypothetical protein